MIPVHNGEAYVAEAIRSVLGQTRPVLECIVIDDGSTDATAETVRQFAGVTYIRQEQAGVSAARNHGARVARGDLVAFLDHDDVWEPTKIERQAANFGDPAAFLCMCGHTVIDADGAALETRRMGPVDRLLGGLLLFDGTPTLSCSSTGVARRERLLAMGGFDEGLSISADWDFLIRALLEGKVVYVDEPLVRYRVHGSNMSRKLGAMETDMRQVFDKAFAHPALPEDLRRRRREAYGRMYRMLAGSYRDAGELRPAARTFVAAVRHDPRVAVELVGRPRRRARR